MAQEKSLPPTPSLGRTWQLLLPVSVTCHCSLSPPCPPMCCIVAGEGGEPGSPQAAQLRGTCVQGAAPLCSETGPSPTHRGKSQLTSAHRAAQGVGSGNRAFHAKKSPWLGRLTPVAVLGPFSLSILGNMRQLSFRDKGPHASSCSSTQHLPEHPGTNRQLRPSLLLLEGLLGAHPTENPTHVSPVTSPNTGVYWPTAVMSVSGLRMTLVHRARAEPFKPSCFPGITVRNSTL